MLINSPIDLKMTQYSGQTSQPPWIKENNSYKNVIFVEGKPVLACVSQENNNLDFSYELPINADFKLSEDKIKEKIAYIYDLNFDLEKFYRYLSNDEVLSPIFDFSFNLRLFLAKNKFEAIISSISSANNSIARWTKSIEVMKDKWGLKFTFPSGEFHAFPTMKTIGLTFEDAEEEFGYTQVEDINQCVNNLKSCGLGYRSNYIKKAADFFTKELNIQDISKMNYEDAFEVIQEVPGVGPKVADCILLYGYNFREAFPTDVWIKRIVSYLYFDGKNISVKKVRDFGIETFGDYAGYVQLYLFHYARKSGLMQKLNK